MRKNDSSVLARASHVIRCFVHGSDCKASLERLRIRISEFRELTNDALKLASSRKRLIKAVPDLPPDLQIVQDCASHLYDVVKTGWTCDCQNLHPTHMQLDTWSLPSREKDDDARIRFAFLFADDARHAQNCHWMTAEMTASRSPHERRPAAAGPPCTNPEATSLSLRPKSR